MWADVARDWLNLSVIVDVEFKVIKRNCAHLRFKDSSRAKLICYVIANKIFQVHLHVHEGCVYLLDFNWSLYTKLLWWTINCNEPRRKHVEPSLFTARIRKLKPGYTPTADGDKGRRWPLLPCVSLPLLSANMHHATEKRHLSQYYIVQIRYTRLKHVYIHTLVNSALATYSFLVKETSMTSCHLNHSHKATVVFIFLSGNWIFCMQHPI